MWQICHIRLIIPSHRFHWCLTDKDTYSSYRTKIQMYVIDIGNSIVDLKIIFVMCSDIQEDSGPIKTPYSLHKLHSNGHDPMVLDGLFQTSYHTQASEITK